MTLPRFLPIYIVSLTLFRFFSSKLAVPPTALDKVLRFQCEDILLITVHVLLVVHVPLWKQKRCMRVAWVHRDWCIFLTAFQFWPWLWSSRFMPQCDPWTHWWILRELWSSFRSGGRHPWGEAELVRKTLKYVPKRQGPFCSLIKCTIIIYYSYNNSPKCLCFGCNRLINEICLGSLQYLLYNRMSSKESLRERFSAVGSKRSYNSIRMGKDASDLVAFM